VSQKIPGSGNPYARKSLGQEICETGNPYARKHSQEIHKPGNRNVAIRKTTEKA
jgi:hypothetical protein